MVSIVVKEKHQNNMDANHCSICDVDWEQINSSWVCNSHFKKLSLTIKHRTVKLFYKFNNTLDT